MMEGGEITNNEDRLPPADMIMIDSFTHSCVVHNNYRMLYSPIEPKCNVNVMIG
jgi:hypothetical protein